VDNFRFHIPTEIIFGKGTHLEVGKEVKKYADKILLVRLAKESLERIGVYSDIIKSLEENGISYIELDGIVPNPRLSKVREGVEICKQNNIKFILAVGGGSVVDTSKAIAAGSCIDGDYWDIVEGKTPFVDSLKIGTIITIPATGTEMNTSTVITRDEDSLKRGFNLAHPTFSILNPELAKTLPKRRIAQSVVDMLAHAMERYFTNTEAVDLTDRMLEGVMKTIVRLGPKFYHDGYDYQTVSQVMYAATVAHNFSLCVGRVNDFASHQIGHELSGEYDLPHGESLSIIFPSWLKYVRNHDSSRIAQFFVNVFGIENNFLDADETIDRGITALEAFYQGLGMPVRISQTNIKNCDIAKLAKQATNNGAITRGNFVTLNTEDIYKIYQGAL
jgi:alcohol dehydrogenase YqhD (iron-dependent ADH family)